MRLMHAAATANPFLFRQRWLLLGLGAFFLFVNIQYLLKVRLSDRDNPSAIIRWLSQLQELREGHNIWLGHNYPNPPIMALILTPFALLPTAAAALVWFYFKVAL